MVASNRSRRLALSLIFVVSSSQGQTPPSSDIPNIPKSARAEAPKYPGAQSVRKAAAQRLGELPPLKTVQLAAENGDLISSILAMGITTPFIANIDKGISLLNPDNFAQQTANKYVVYPGMDLVKFEVGVIEDFVQGTGVFSQDTEPASSKGVIVLRYGLEDDRARDMFAQLAKSGLHSTVLVTDGPITMEAKGPKFETREDRNGKTVEVDFSNDIRPEFLSNSANGPDVKTMLQNGFKIYSPVLPKQGELIQAGDFYVAMSAIANANLDRKPIMHEKEALMYVLKDPKGPVIAENIKKLYVMHGTGNWTRTHVNRDFLYRDPSKGVDGPGFFALVHAMNTLETFVRPGKTAKIADIPTPGRTRYVDTSGQFWEPAYTDGKFELNQRMVDQFNMLAGDQETIQRLANGNAEEVARLTKISENVEVDEIRLSHFVMTNTKVVEAIFRLWQSQFTKGRPFKVTGALDAKFVGLRSFGLGAIMAGYDTRTDFGKTRKALGEEFAKYVKIVVQMEEAPDKDGKPPVNIDPDGPPHDRVLWHDKTTTMTYRLSSGEKARTDVWTGSYNNSNNSSNLERQDWFSVFADSKFARSVNGSIDSAVKAAIVATEKGIKKVLPLESAVFVLELARFLGQSPIDLDWQLTLSLKNKMETLNKLPDANRQAVLQDLGLKLMKMGSRPSRLAKAFQLDHDNLYARLNAMSRFFSWYTSEPTYKQGFQAAISANEMLSLALAVTERPLSAKMALMDIFWRPLVPRSILEARAFKVYQAMGLQQIYDKKLENWKGDKKPYESGGFPFSSELVFTVDMLGAPLIKNLTELVFNGKLEDVAKTLSEWAQKTGERAAQAANQGEILTRLRELVGMLKWYIALPRDPNSKNQVVELDKSAIVSQLLSENLDLLLLKEQPHDRVVETVRYLISLKGYRDNRDGSPGVLSIKLKEGLQYLRIGADSLGLSPVGGGTKADQMSPALGAKKCAAALL